jgi:hypothetical protein
MGTIWQTVIVPGGWGFLSPKAQKSGVDCAIIYPAIVNDQMKIKTQSTPLFLDHSAKNKQIDSNDLVVHLAQTAEDRYNTQIGM